MSRYMELRNNPADPTVGDLKKDMDIVILEMVSVMCDNVAYLKIKKNDEDTVRINHYNDHCALSFSNLQAEPNAQEMMRWAMMDNNLKEMIRIANSGTSVVASVKVRGKVKEEV